MSPLAIIIGATLIWLAAVGPGPNFLVVSRLALDAPLSSFSSARQPLIR